MQSQSYGRLLRRSFVLLELVALVMLLTPEAAPAAGSVLQASRDYRSRDTGIAHSSYAATSMTTVDTIPTADSIAPPQDSTLSTTVRRSRGGYMVTAEQLAMEQDSPLSSVLAAHFPGVRVIYGSDVDRVANGLNLEMTGKPCFLQVFKDGVYISNGGIDWVSIRDLASIEYRTPGNIPVQFQNRLPGAMCGVLLFWSRYSGL